MPVRRALALTALVATAALSQSSALAAPPRPAPLAGTTVAFSPPVALNNDTGASTGGSEPSIEIDSRDNVYVSAPVGVPTGGCPFWYVHPDTLNSDGLPYEYRGTIDTDQNSVGGGDCDISISDNDAVGATHDTASVTSLSLANLTSNKTTDGGETWQTIANPASQQVFGVDRQWQAADRGLDRHYLSVHDLIVSNIQVSVSIDGGYQYVENVPAIDPTTTPQALGTVVYSPNRTPSGNQFGTTVINPVTHKLYIPFIAASADNIGGLGNAVYIAEGDPCSLAPCEKGLPAGPIKWVNHLIYAAPKTADLSSGFPAITIDEAGVVYVAWTGDSGKPATAGSGPDSNRVFLSHSQPGNVSSDSWSTPVAIDPGTGHGNIFPWLVASEAGHVGAVWYSSVKTNRCVGTPVDLPPPAITRANDSCFNAWKVSYASSLNASSASPAWDVVSATGVVHEGSICDDGLNCADGTRTLLDFFDVALDSMGRPNIAYVSDMASRGRADIYYTRQCACGTLNGTLLEGGCAAIGEPVGCPASAAFVDPPGDAGTPSNPALDVLSSRLTTITEDNTIDFRVVVDDLTPPTPGVTQNFIYSFVFKNKRYYVEAARSTELTEFLVGDFTAAGGSRKSYKSIDGSFNDADDSISMILGLNDLTSAPIVIGDVFGTLSITSGGAIGHPDVGSLTPTADAAAGACPFTVGAVAADPIVPEVPWTAVFPIAAMIGLGSYIAIRRRRTGAHVAA